MFCSIIVLKLVPVCLQHTIGLLHTRHHCCSATFIHMVQYRAHVASVKIECYMLLNYGIIWTVWFRSEPSLYCETSDVTDDREPPKAGVVISTVVSVSE